MRETHCRVCGLETGDDCGWVDGVASYDICSCCGATFGYQDCTIKSTIAYRRAWMARGAPWFDPEDKPIDWDLPKQLAQVSEDFKDPNPSGLAHPTTME
jgi:hypothetical protein